MRFRFRNKTKKADLYREMCEFTETKCWRKIVFIRDVV